MKSLKSLDHLLETLRGQIFSPHPAKIPLVYRKAESGERSDVIKEPRTNWQTVGPDLIWGEPDGYFWFAGQVTIPNELEGERVYLFIEAQFGNVMGRSDPQCLVRINGKITQGSDANHREMLLTESAKAGECFEILVEAGTIEDRRQCGFACKLLVHDPVAEDLYYDLRTPYDVAILLDENDPRRDFILNKVSEAVDAIDYRFADKERFHKSCVAAKEIARKIYDATDFGEQPVITVTGHTHIDVAWLWRIRETRQKMARSMATALSLMEQYPDYQFMYNQGLLLDYLSEDYPELFERIKQRKEAGQFEIEGALWLEPDANITSGESFVRHIQHGIAYHEETFGVRPTIMWLPDTFGYSAALPQLMKQSGIDVFITHKMSWNDTNKMPYETFHWQGIDGTKVPAYFLTTQPYTSTSIGTTYCPNLKATHVMGTWKRHGQKDLNDELFLVYGHGDGGGGPTREMLEHIRRMEKGIPGCPTVKHGTMGGFFKDFVKRVNEIPEQFPTWVGELYLEFHRGTLTSVAKNKRYNRLAEQTLRELEALASYASVKGHAYPSDELHRLWRITLLNQFHDILPGSGIGAVYEDSDADYEAFFAEAAALQKNLYDSLNTGGTHTIFNSLGRSRKALVAIEGEQVQAVEWQGASIPAQKIIGADGTHAQAVSLDNIPPLTPLSLTKTTDGTTNVDTSLKVSTDHIENDLVVAKFDGSGRLVSLVDKRCGREVIKSGNVANRLQAYRDLPPQFDAWDIDQSFEDQIWDIDDLVSAEVVEEGPYRAAIRFEWRYESSKIVQIVALEENCARLDIDCFVDWHEHNTMVKAAFPIEVKTDKSTAEIQFGHVSRPTYQNTSWDQARFETAMHRWVDVSEENFGVALFNDCKYGYDAKDTTLRLTLLRSPTWPWAEADQGEHRMKYALYVHHGLIQDDVPAKAEEFNLSLLAHKITQSDRAEADDDLSSLLQLKGRGVTIEAVKQAEAKDGLVVRLWETLGKVSKATLTLPSTTDQAWLVDLLEQPEAEMLIEAGEVTLTFNPFEIKTIKFTV